MISHRRSIPTLVAAVAIMVGSMTSISAPAQAATTTTSALPALGALPPITHVAPRVPAAGAGALAVPASVDLSPWAETPVHQGGLGSCVTWAIDYGMLGWYGNHDGRAGRPFAPMYTYSQIKAAPDDGLANGTAEGGSYPQDALKVALSQGSDTQADYWQGNFDANTPPTAAERANAANYKISGYHVVFSGAGQVGNTDAIKAELAAGHPVAIGIPVRKGFDDLSNNHSTTAVDADTTTAIRGYHEILALGYNESGLLIQNSWGTGFGHVEDVAAGNYGGFGRLSWAVVQNDITDAYAIDGLAAPKTGVSSFSPTSGTPGTVVTIKGTNLTGATGVKFGSKAAGFTVNSSTQITATVPAGAVTAPITVTTPAGTSTSTSSFTMTTGVLLGNPGFESGSANTAPWVASAGVVDNSTAQPARSGTWKAWLNGRGSANTETLYQDVTIPAGVTSATLSLWLHIDTLETGASAYDTMNVQVRNTANTVLATLASYSNLNAAAGYAQKAFNVSAYAGQTIRIYLVGQEDASLRTSFVIDDVALKAQLLRNPGFESGSANTAPWVASAGVVDNSTAQPARSGTWKAWLNGRGSANTETLYQDVTIPAGVTSATLSLWLHIDTLETGASAYDTMNVQVRNTANTVLATLASYSNLNAAAGYAQKAFNVSAYAGQTIRIYLVGQEDASLRTSFVIDDVALTRT